MTNDKSYNGWTNYETWLLALWFDNEQGLYSYRSEAIEDIAKRCDDRDEANLEGMNWLKNEVEESDILGEIPETGFIADLVNSALSEVNYYEIAEHWLDDIWHEYHPEVTCPQCGSVSYREDGELCASCIDKVGDTCR